MFENYSHSISYFECETDKSKVILYEAEAKFDSLLFSASSGENISMYDGVHTFKLTKVSDSIHTRYEATESNLFELHKEFLKRSKSH